MHEQDLRHFLSAYRRDYPEDMLVLGESVQDGQELTALVSQQAARGRHPVLLAPQVWGVDVAVVTNLFASRERIGRMLVSLGREEVDSIIEELTAVTVTCDFCGRQYSFDAVDVAQLFASGETAEADDSRRH